MKTTKFINLILGLCLVGTAPLLGAAFDSGSNGSYGPLNVTNDTTLDLPPDGIFNCTTITIASGATLRFNPNAFNTPVYLLTTGDVVIQGLINVSGGDAQAKTAGKGGPGGFDGGFGGFLGFPAGDGQGPGGGKVSGERGAAFAFVNGENTNIYGNTLLSPLIGGSGGSGVLEFGGGGGGGAILIASNTKATINGRVMSFGGAGACCSPSGAGAGRGSSGAVRVVAPVVDGSGVLWVEAPNAGGGRTRIDSLDRFSYRNLSLGGSKGTTGSQMFVFPPNNPRLDILEVAGTAIPEGTANRVSITLPVGSSQNQTVKVQARNFTNDLQVTVAVTPENGHSTNFFGVIAHSGNPSFAQIPVVLPIDGVNHIFVWTR